MIKGKEKSYMKWLSDITQESRTAYVHMRQMVKVKVNNEKMDIGTGCIGA